jgi:hypothetical protein
MPHLPVLKVLSTPSSDRCSDLRLQNDADRLAAIAEKQIEAFKAQRSSLVIAPTHGECRAIAGAMRKAMKRRGPLSDSEHSVTRLQRLNLTDSQQRDAVTYQPGQIVEFHWQSATGSDSRKTSW